MAEYILRDQAIIAVTGAKLPDVSASGLSIANGKRSVTDCVRRLKEIPAADVRPVVLCRDCDCWNDWDSAGKESLGNYVCSCAHWTVEDGAVFYTRPTDFCSYGEKEEES